MSGFCAAVDAAACDSRISNLSISGSALRILPILLAVPCSSSVLPIDIGYQVFDTARCSYLQHLGGGGLLVRVDSPTILVFEI